MGCVGSCSVSVLNVNSGIGSSVGVNVDSGVNYSEEDGMSSRDNSGIEVVPSKAALVFTAHAVIED